jgi:hypothetical protein
MGTQRQKEILERIATGRPLEGDVDRLLDTGWTMTDSSLCGLGQTAASAVLSAIKLWPALFTPGSDADLPKDDKLITGLTMEQKISLKLMVRKLLYQQERLSSMQPVKPGSIFHSSATMRLLLRMLSADMWSMSRASDAPTACIMAAEGMKSIEERTSCSIPADDPGIIKLHHGFVDSPEIMDWCIIVDRNGIQRRRSGRPF